MRNILVLNYEFPPLGGGQANANYFLFKEFSKNKNCSFTLITSSIDTYKEEKFSDNIKIYYLDIGKKGGDLHNQSIINLLVNLFKTFKLSKKLIKKEKHDLVMAWSYPAIGLGYLFKKIYKIPYITLLRGADVPFYEKKWKNLDTFMFKYLAPIFWRNSKHVIVNSKGLQQMALRISKDQTIEIIPNGVDTDFYTYDETKKITDRFIILGVGRLIERKGFDILIKSVSKIKNNQNIEIWLVGDGPEKEKLKILAKKHKINLKLFGLQDKEQLKEIYKKATIFCLPSKNEGMSNTLLEAISSGLPVIVTNVGGSEELVKNNGYIIAVDDQGALQEKIEILHSDSKKVLEFTNNSIKFSKELSWKNTAKEFIKYL